jgi:hypothetical protein
VFTELDNSPKDIHVVHLLDLGKLSVVLGLFVSADLVFGQPCASGFGWWIPPFMALRPTGSSACVGDAHSHS